MVAGRTIDYLKRLLFVGVCLLAVLPALASARPSTPEPEPLSEVVIELSEPGLAKALGGDGRLELDTPTSLRRLTRIAVQQESVEQRIRTLIPSAQVSWRYRVVLNAFAVVVPQRAVERLERLDGIREVHRAVRFGCARACRSQRGEYRE